MPTKLLRTLLIQIIALQGWGQIHESKPNISDWSQGDVEIFERGEISNTRYLLGGTIGTLVGFGSGHAIQGRFNDPGKKFLAYDAGALGFFLAGSIAACGLQGSNGGSNECRTTQNIGAAILIGVRLWEAYDLWTTPIYENKRYRDLTKKHNHDSFEIASYLVPYGANEMTTGLFISF